MLFPACEMHAMLLNIIPGDQKPLLPSATAHAEAGHLTLAQAPQSAPEIRLAVQLRLQTAFLTALFAAMVFLI